MRRALSVSKLRPSSDRCPSRVMQTIVETSTDCFSKIKRYANVLQTIGTTQAWGLVVPGVPSGVPGITNGRPEPYTVYAVYDGRPDAADHNL